MEQTTKIPQFRIFMLLSLLLSFSLFAEERNYREKSESPYFEIENKDIDIADFKLEGTDVDVEINGVIAKVKVKQRYSNKSQSAVNASYIFPASMYAAVHSMEMDLNGKKIKAKIKEKNQAQKEFNEAKSTGKSASLLKQKRPNVFSMDLANIMPGDYVEIDMEYTEMIVPADGTYSFVYPTVVGPRYTGEAAPEKWTSNPYLKEGKTPNRGYTIKTTIEAGLPLSDVKCKSHDVDVNWQGERSALVELKQGSDFAGNRDYILNYRLQGGAIETGLVLHEGKDENFFCMMMQPPKRVELNEIPNREYIFVMDVSGSMHGFPLETSKDLMRNLLSTLRPEEKFNVVLFSGGSKRYSDRSVPATAENIKNATAFVTNRNSGGGTNLLSAMKNSLSIPKEDGFSRSVVVVTDGYISAEKRCFEYIEENLNNTNFFSFGIGTSVNRYLVDGLAKVGRGEAFIVTSRTDSKGVTEKFRKYISSPVLTDVKVQFEGFDTYDVEPMSVPDLFAERPIVVYGKWRGEPHGNVIVTGVNGNGPYESTMSVGYENVSKKATALPFLWARKKIEALSDFNSGYIEPEVQDEITTLGLKYNLLTKYTSFIAVHEEIRNPGGQAKNVKTASPLPKGVSNHAIGSGGGGYYSSHSTPEPEFYLLLLGALCMGIFYMRRSTVREEK